MSTKVYLIRHAEAEGNLYRRIQGQYNSAVTERGLRQITALKRRFEGIHVDKVYSSDLSRTISTAKAIYVPHGLELCITPRLREVNVGAWEDLTWGYVEHTDAQQLEYFNKAPDLWHVEGSESHFDLQKRITDEILEIASENDGKAVAVVSHGMAIRAFMCGVYGYGPREVSRVSHYDNTSVTQLSVADGVITVEKAGDNSHLDPKDSTFSHQDWWKNKSLNDSKNVWYTPFDFENGEEYYAKARKGAAMGDYPGSFERAREFAAKDARSVMNAVLGDTRIGLIELDMQKGAAEGEGWIELYYVENEYRGCGLSVQYLGHATSAYRQLGRKTLNVKVNSEARHAIGFFRHYGFEQLPKRDDGFVNLAKPLACER